jgi:hypothetical protein
MNVSPMDIGPMSLSPITESALGGRRGALARARSAVRRTCAVHSVT